jgi:hypothetical protein
VVLDTKGNIFGGFTPVEWESSIPSSINNFKENDSLKSFVFTLKNPHNIPARKFALQAQEKSDALWCDSDCGPCFGNEISIENNCNTGTNNSTVLGNTYINDTGLDKNIVFAGSETFQVKEIEVFEITA